MREASLKHFVERLRPVFDEGRYCGALVQAARVAMPRPLVGEEVLAEILRISFRDPPTPPRSTSWLSTPPGAPPVTAA
jgi:hypothetical protein